MELSRMCFRNSLNRVTLGVLSFVDRNIVLLLILLDLTSAGPA